MPDTTDPCTVLAFDYGLKRIGVAVGQTVTGSATPLATLNAADTEGTGRAVDALVREWRPARLLLGEPATFAPDEPVRQAIRSFAETLSRYGLPVEFVDESLSSHEAESRLAGQRRERQRGRVRKTDIDAEAARIIAERWLAQAGGTGGP